MKQTRLKQTLLEQTRRIPRHYVTSDTGNNDADSKDAAHANFQ